MFNIKSKITQTVNYASEALNISYTKYIFKLHGVYKSPSKFRVTSIMSVLLKDNKWDIYNKIPNYNNLYGIIIKIFKFYQPIYLLK